MSGDEQPFISELQANPYDDSPRLVYADWLEERGDPRGEYLRLECELAGLEAGDALFAELAPRLHELRRKIDSAWLAAVGRTKIANCLTTAFECPQRWDRLKPLSDPLRRYCSSCRKFVHYCRTIDEARGHVRRGRCVALDSAVYRNDRDWLSIEQRERAQSADLLEEQCVETIGIVVFDAEADEPR